LRFSYRTHSLLPPHSARLDANGSKPGSWIRAQVATPAKQRSPGLSRSFAYSVHRARDQCLSGIRAGRVADGSAVSSFAGTAGDHRRDFASWFRSAEGRQEFLQPIALGVQRSV